MASGEWRVAGGSGERRVVILRVLECVRLVAALGSARSAGQAGNGTTTLGVRGWKIRLDVCRAPLGLKAATSRTHSIIKAATRLKPLRGLQTAVGPGQIRFDSSEHFR